MKCLIVFTMMIACNVFALRADINRDGIVNFVDFAILAEEWMMSEAETIEACIFDLLRFDSTVYGIAANRIYPETIPQGSDRPAVKYNLISAPRDHNFDAMTNLVPARFQITVQATTYTQAAALSNAVIDCLDSKQTTCGNIEIASILCIDENDFTDVSPGTDQLKVYGRDIDFRITYRRY